MPCRRAGARMREANGTRSQMCCGFGDNPNRSLLPYEQSRQVAKLLPLHCEVTCFENSSVGRDNFEPQNEIIGHGIALAARGRWQLVSAVGLARGQTLQMVVSIRLRSAEASRVRRRRRWPLFCSPGQPHSIVADTLARQEDLHRSTASSNRRS